MPTERLGVAGIRDDNDAQRVRHALSEVWGIQQVVIDPSRGEVMFSYDERAGSREDFLQAIRSSGFEITGKIISP